MNIVDIIIVILLLLGALLGFRKGALRSIVSFLGLIIVFVLSYSIKNVLVKYFYTNLPFFDFKGYVKGASVLNIFFYEILAFVIIAVILTAVVSFIGRLSSVIQKILDGTIVFGLFSRVVGIIVGTLEMYMLIFVALYILNLPIFGLKFVEDSRISPTILYKTPFVKDALSETNSAVEEIKSLKTMYKETKNVDEFNYKSLDVLLKYNIITKDSVELLIEKDKLHIKNIDELLEKY